MMSDKRAKILTKRFRNCGRKSDRQVGRDPKNICLIETLYQISNGHNMARRQTDKSTNILKLALTTDSTTRPFGHSVET